MTAHTFTVGDLAERTGTVLFGDSQIVVTGVSSLTSLRPGTVVFAERERDLPRALGSAIAAVVSSAAPTEPGPVAVLQSTQVRRTFAQICQLLFAGYPTEKPGVHAAAVIDPTAELGPDVAIGAGVVVGARCKIGAHTTLRARVVVDEGVTIGSDCYVFPGVVLGRGTVVGDRCVIHPNAVIGSEGFGFTEGFEAALKQPQFGSVRIGNDCEIGAGTCIDRGTLDDTILGDDVKLDNLIQIGHNVRIGDHVRIAAQCAFAGGSVVEDFCIIAGQVGVNNRVTIGRGSLVGGQSGVTRDIAPGSQVWGLPARNHRDKLKEQVFIQRLPELAARLDAIETQVSHLTGIEEDRDDSGEVPD
ncbi:MAG: UDP-3-O-(3-hydroxymyristoyl)glucosamine N-acyltransferase [bacterium]